MATLVAGLALATAAPAWADVKAGVDAWVAGDFARAVAEWRAPAAKGDADALFNLAQAYRLGRGVPQDMAEAEALYARAAAAGHLQAADNYGILLFQNGRRDAAMPYLTAAAGRGDPRAQYLLGIAHFNGDGVARDWVRAYALLTLANGAGLPQAAAAIAQMDAAIPLAQRQQAQVLAVDLRQQTDARRASQMAAADLDDVTGGAVPTAVAVAANTAPSAGTPATAGADFARPAQPAPRPVTTAAAKPAPTPAPAVPKSAPAAAGGPWKVQLGAFAVAANADRLWSQLAGKAPLAGKSRQMVRSGAVTRLLAAGWSSQGAAQAACNALKASGQGCIVTR